MPASGANDWTAWKKPLLNTKLIRQALFTNAGIRLKPQKQISIYTVGFWTFIAHVWVGR